MVANMKFEEIYSRYFDTLVKKIQNWGVKYPESEDLAQDSFEKAWKYHGDDIAVGSLDRIAYTLTINYKQKQSNRKRLEEEHIQGLPLDDILGYTDEGDLEPQDLDTPEALIEAEQLTEVLDGALNRISPELREVFLLREIQELSYEDIANRLNISVNLARKRLERAKDALKATI